MTTLNEVMEMIRLLSPAEILILSQNLKESLKEFDFHNFIESNRFSEGFICPRCKSKNNVQKIKIELSNNQL